MAVFSTDEPNDHRLDWTILRDGGVELYWRPDILADDIDWLESNGYKVISFEAAEWRSEDQMHDSFRTALGFPDYYGNNLNALEDCIWNDLLVPDTGGLVLVLNHYDQFAEAVQIEGSNERSFAATVLHVLARAIRYQMLFGKRLMILVQSSDPRIRFEHLAEISADWNRREWLNKNRGL